MDQNSVHFIIVNLILFTSKNIKTNANNKKQIICSTILTFLLKFLVNTKKKYKKNALHLKNLKKKSQYIFNTQTSIHINTFTFNYDLMLKKSYKQYKPHINFIVLMKNIILCLLHFIFVSNWRVIYIKIYQI